MIPTFVVVGHPNKGKSSIVSTLVMDDSIAISDTPGTTKKSREFSLKVDNKTRLKLIDTPGFQRPKRVLEFLKSFGDVGALQRPKLLKKFVETYEDDKRFADEVELLKPIIDGAGILYVVDASKPYSDEYEVQMEILRYSANPSMAILNYIGDEDFTKEWDMVLGQYFRLVKRFDPLKSSKEDYFDLLDALSHINPVWQQSLKEVKHYIALYHDRLILDISKLIVQKTKEILSLKLQAPYTTNKKEELKRRFEQKLIMIEKQMQDEIKTILNFKKLEIKSDHIKLPSQLLSQRSREIFGLSREKLIILSAISGGLVGGSVDLALGFHTFGLGFLIGGVSGALGTLYKYDEISKIKFISKDVMQIGPIGDINFGFIFLNRAVLFAKTLLTKTHANRDANELQFEREINFFSDDEIKKIASINKKFKNSKESKEDVDKYVSVIKKVLSEHI